MFNKNTLVTLYLLVPAYSDIELAMEFL